MHRIWQAAFAALTVSVLLACSVTATEAVPRMSAEELQSRLGDPDLVVVDVRRGADWQASDRKVAGALREEPAQVRNWANSYDRGKTLVLYCQ